MPLRLRLQAPILAVGRIEVGVGGVAVGELHVLAVPLEPLLGADGDVAEQDDLGQVGGVAVSGVRNLLMP
jgi:hypothetical protein